MLWWHLCAVSPHFVKVEPWIHEIPDCLNGLLSSIRLCCVTDAKMIFCLFYTFSITLMFLQYSKQAYVFLFFPFYLYVCMLRIPRIHKSYNNSTEKNKQKIILALMTKFILMELSRPLSCNASSGNKKKKEFECFGGT